MFGSNLSIPFVSRFIIPSAVHVNSPVTISCRRTTLWAQSVRLEKDKNGVGILVFSTMMIYHLTIPKNGYLMKENDGLTLRINKASCTDAGRYTCKDLSGTDGNLPSVTKFMAVFDLHGYLKLANNRYPGHKDCIYRECQQCVLGTKFYYPVGSSIKLRCETFLPNLKAMQKSTLYWTGVDNRHFTEDMRNSDIHPSQLSYGYRGCVANKKIWISMVFKPMYSKTTSLNIGCMAEFKLEGTTLFSLSQKHTLCLIGSTIYDTPKILLSTDVKFPAVFKDKHSSITCKRQHENPDFLILFKDREMLVNMSLRETKIVANHLPHHGYNLKISTNTLKLTIHRSTCRDAGYYTCRYYKGTYYVTNTTKVLRVIDKLNEPLITPTRHTTCYSQECHSCDRGSQAYIRVNENLGLTCSWSAPKWDAITTSSAWKRMEPGKYNVTLPGFITRIINPTNTPKSTVSTCIPSQMKTSSLLYQPQERNSVNFNIFCVVNYALKGLSAFKTYGKLPVCVLVDRKSASKHSSDTDLTTKLKTTSLQTTVKTTKLQIIVTTTAGSQRKPTHQQFISTTENPRTYVSEMIAAIVVGVMAVIGLIVTMVYIFIDKLVLSKVNESKSDISNRRRSSNHSIRSIDESQSDISNRRRSSNHSKRIINESKLDNLNRQRSRDSSGKSSRQSRSDFSGRTSKHSRLSRSSNFDSYDIGNYYED